MVVFRRADQRIPDQGIPPTPATWDYARRGLGGMFANDIVYATCPFGHTIRIVSTVHRVSANGTLYPSYVCTVPKCRFHEWVRLDGWQAL